MRTALRQCGSCIAFCMITGEARSTNCANAWALPLTSEAGSLGFYQGNGRAWSHPSVWRPRISTRPADAGVRCACERGAFFRDFGHSSFPAFAFTMVSGCTISAHVVARCADGSGRSKHDAAVTRSSARGCPNWQSFRICSFASNSGGPPPSIRMRPPGAACLLRHSTGWSVTSEASPQQFGPCIRGRLPTCTVYPLRERWWRVRLTCFRIGPRTYTG